MAIQGTIPTTTLITDTAITGRTMGTMGITDTGVIVIGAMDIIMVIITGTNASRTNLVENTEPLVLGRLSIFDSNRFGFGI